MAGSSNEQGLLTGCVEMQSPRLHVDPGEMHSGVIKALEKQDIEIEITKLEAGDYVAYNGIGFQRMTIDDLLKSIFGDIRLLSQIRDFAGHYERPVLIIEGEDPFCSGQTMNPGSIQGFLKIIAVSIRVPVIFTLNEVETAEVVSSIATAEHESLTQSE